MSSDQTKDIALASSLPAVATNGRYVLVKDGLARITFLESFIPETVAPRVAVAMSVEGLIGVRTAIDEALSSLEKQKADAMTAERSAHARLN